MKPVISNDYVLICLDGDNMKTLLCALTHRDSVTIKRIITWLNERGSKEMPKWQLYKVDTKPTSAQRMVDKIAFYGRYDETDTNGEYYGGPNELLEKHLSGQEIITAHTLLKMTGLNVGVDNPIMPRAQDMS